MLVFIPTTIGSQQINIRAIGQPEAASHGLRPKRPQLPPLTYCNMSSTREPSVGASQNMNAKSQERRNCVQFMKAPIAAPMEKSTPTIKAMRLQRGIAAGGAKAAGVILVVKLMASALPASVQGSVWKSREDSSP